MLQQRYHTDDLAEVAMRLSFAMELDHSLTIDAPESAGGPFRFLSPLPQDPSVPKGLKDLTLEVWSRPLHGQVVQSPTRLLKRVSQELHLGEIKQANGAYFVKANGFLRGAYIRIPTWYVELQQKREATLKPDPGRNNRRVRDRRP